MGNINILEGSFPRQSASILDKSFMVPKAMLSLKTKEKEVRFYNLRAALKTIETIVDGPKPTIKIELADGNSIIGTVDEKGFTTLKVALAMGTDSEDVIFVPAHKRGQASKSSSKWGEQLKVSPSFALSVIGLLIFFFYMALDDGPSTSKSALRSVDDTTLKAIAQTLCKGAVKAGLKAPSTADFPWAGGSVSFEANSDIAIYTSYVDAQNGFGAEMRTNFVCTIKFTGGDVNDVNQWKTINLETF